MDTNKIIVKNALKITLGIVCYFFLMKFMNLENNVELRLLNFIFVAWGVNSSIKSNININKSSSYIENLFLGIATSVLAVLITVFLLAIYVSFISPEFITTIENSFIWGNDLNLPLVVFALSIEGIASSVIYSFTIMQYWKKYQVKNYKES